MAEHSSISWTDATFNPGIGCTEVSTAASGGGGCDGCYARELAQRYRWAKWGAGEPRHRTSIATWKKVEGWNRKAAMANTRMRVFCASLADVFDNEVPHRWRGDLWKLIRMTPALDWLIVTKRIGNAAKMLPADWGHGYPNVTLLITVVNQAEAERDIGKLLDMPAARRGLSVEPMLGPIDLTRWLELGGCDSDRGISNPGLDWVICGGETDQGKHKARPMHPAWARALRDQCAAANVAFHFKQWGEWNPVEVVDYGDGPFGIGAGGDPLHTYNNTPVYPAEMLGEQVLWKVGTKRAGRTLDGVEHNGFPAQVVA